MNIAATADKCCVSNSRTCIRPVCPQSVSSPLADFAVAANDMVCLWMPLSWANEVQYTGLNEAATKENDNGILCWIGRVRQRNVDLYYG
jgi:hypothetical protein